MEPNSLQPHLDAILDGRAVLFVGAGFTRGARNVAGAQLPNGQELAKHFTNLVGMNEELSLEAAAEVVLDELGPDTLATELRRLFAVTTPTAWQKEILHLPWARVYTTNYDNLVERAGSMAGRVYAPATLDDDLYRFPKDDTICIHLNGYIERITSANVATAVKLTESSYMAESIVDSPWVSLLREDVRNASAMFYIGYSMYDLDLKRVLLEGGHSRDKSIFVIGRDPHEVVQRRVSKFGVDAQLDAAEFSEIVKARSIEYIPRQDAEAFLSLTERVRFDPSVPLSDKSLEDLFVLGNWTTPQVQESLRSGSQFYLRRSRVDQALALLTDNRELFVTSSLGNGKSLFLEGLVDDSLRSDTVSSTHLTCPTTLSAKSRL